MSDLVSVIVPIYNVEQYLERCIKSIQNQTYKNLEIILVDDGSPDKCGEICDRYEKEDSRIRVVHKVNGGLSSARNAGIEVANGEFFMFIDSDDCIASNTVERLYSICGDSNKEIDIVICGYKRFSKDGEISTIDSSIKNNISIIGKDDAMSRIYSHGVKYVVAWNKMYRRTLFTNVRYKEGKLNEDEFTTYKLYGNANKIAEIDDLLYFYFYNGNSITTNEKYMISQDLYEAFDECIEYYKENNYEKALKVIKKAYLDRIISRCKMAYELRPAKEEYCRELLNFYRKKYSVFSKDVSGIGYRIFYVSYRLYFGILRIKER